MPNARGLAQVCVKRGVFYLLEPLYCRGQQIAICGGCTSGCVCSCLSWLLSQLCCGGHTAHTRVWFKYCMCTCEHCGDPRGERKDINTYGA